MKILFVHQNMPGQFKHLVRFLVDERKADVVFATRRTDLRIPGVRVACYSAPRGAQPSTHPYLRRSENAVLHGQQVARIGLELLRQGWCPDVVVAHPGWGEALFLKDVFPSTPLLNYCEFYYSSHGADMGDRPRSWRSGSARDRGRKTERFGRWACGDRARRAADCGLRARDERRWFDRPRGCGSRRRRSEPPPRGDAWRRGRCRDCRRR